MKIKVGINLVEDDFDESLTKKKYDRSEKSIGGFFEYNYDNLDDFSFNGGIRIDNHNKLNTFITPKFNLKYKINSTLDIHLKYLRIRDFNIENPSYNSFKKYSIPIERAQIEAVKIISKKLFWVTSEDEGLGNPYMYKLEVK